MFTDALILFMRANTIARIEVDFNLGDIFISFDKQSLIMNNSEALIILFSKL